MKLIHTGTLAGLSREAAASPRRRKNLNLHPELSDPVQRLLNAMEPGTYVRPHRHTTPPRWELLAVLSGSVAVLVLDDGGTVLERVMLDARGDNRVLEIPVGAWHTLASMEPGTVLLELKPGPYEAMVDKDFAAWAPKEGEKGAIEMEKRFAGAKIGEYLS